MDKTTFAAVAIAVCAAVTMGLRALPFLLFRGKRETPALIIRLGQVLPYATIGMMVVFCLKDVDVLNGTHGWPELVSCAVVIGLHAWRRNTLLSIIGGTACYMALIQNLPG